MRAGERLRSERAALLVVTVLLAAAVAALLTRDGRPAAVITTNSSTTLALFAGPRAETAPVPGSSPTTTTTTLPSGSSPGGTRPAPAPATEPPGDATAPACLNSFDPACGAFHWEPPVEANTPIRLSVAFEPAQVTAGQAVTVRMTWSDAEGQLGFAYLEAPGSCVPQENGSCVGSSVLGTVGPECPPPYGPWTPPPRGPSGTSTVQQLVYPEPGTYEWRAVVSVSSGGIKGPCDPDPWAERLTQHGTMVVQPAPPPSSTTTTAPPASTAPGSTPPA